MQLDWGVRVIMNGFLLLVPFLLIRFGLLSTLNKSAISRAAYFPPMLGSKMLAYWIYQISNVAIFVYLCFLKVRIEFSWQFFIGIIVYILGSILCAVSMINFAFPSNEGINVTGLYRFSRNPMYLSYFVFFIGCTLLTQSLILFGIVLLFQISSHWIVLSEEQWCVEKFGEVYKQYSKKVRRYI